MSTNWHRDCLIIFCLFCVNIELSCSFVLPNFINVYHSTLQCVIGLCVANTVIIMSYADPNIEGNDGHVHYGSEHLPSSDACDENVPATEDIKSRKEKAHSNWSKIFRPWKWRRKKKSEKFNHTAVTLERKISVRSSRDELVKRGVLTENNGPPATVKDQKDEITKHPDGLPYSRTDEESFQKENKKRQSPLLPNSKREPLMPKYSHKKCPSDDVAREPSFNHRTHHHRLSYQIATASDYSRKVEGDHPALNIGRFQIPSSSGNDLVAVGIIGRDLSRDIRRPNTVKASDSKDRSIVQPLPRSSIESKPSNNLNHPPKQEPSNQDTSLYSAGAIPPGLVSRLSQDLSRAMEGNIPYQAAEHFREGPSIKKPVPLLPSVNDSRGAPVQRPVPAQRMHKNIATTSSNPSSSQKGPPPKPPPKPTKPAFSEISNTGHNQSVPKPYASVQIPQPATRFSGGAKPSGSGESDVVFAASADIIQKATEMRLPPYLKPQTYKKPEETSYNNEFSDDYDSDLSEDIKYRSESGEDDEEDEPECISGLAAKVARKDTFALRLGENRTDKNEANHYPDEENINADKRVAEERTNVRRNLTRRLSQRPTKSELQERNILPNDTAEERFRERENVKRQLSRKLSMRPTVKELIERKVLINWHEYVEVYEVQNYDRRGDKPWTRLTPADKASIRKELNEFKATEMTVHEESRQYTRFHKP